MSQRLNFFGPHRKIDREESLPPQSPAQSEATSTQTMSPQVDNSALEDAVMMLVESTRPVNTQKAYRSRLNEYLAYCETVYAGQMNMYTLKPGRVSRFIFYQVMRSQKKRGGRKASSHVVFDVEDYNKVMGQYGHHLEDVLHLLDPPTNPIGFSSLTLYRAAIKTLFEYQLRCYEINLQWSQVWDFTCSYLHKWVKNKRPLLPRPPTRRRFFLCSLHGGRTI